MDNLFWIGFVRPRSLPDFRLPAECKVMKCSEGDEKMVKIASSIRADANAYLKQQYSLLQKCSAVMLSSC